jgi:hypothetical protein
MYVGAHPGASMSKVATVCRLIGDNWHLWRAIRSGDYALAHFNPSLNRKALIHDGILAFLARLAGIPVVRSTTSGRATRSDR